MNNSKLSLLRIRTPISLLPANHLSYYRNITVFLDFSPLLR
jgi:hypothetical protein